MCALSHFDRLVMSLRRLTPAQLEELKQQVGEQDGLKEFKALVGQRHEATPRGYGLHNLRIKSTPI